jgi:hypothetical protein
MNHKHNRLSGNGKVARALTLLYLLAFVVGVWAAIASYNYPFESAGAVLQNLARSLGIVQIVLLVIISALQKDIYWVTGRAAMDERQVQVRKRIFERSYKVATGFVAVGALLVAANKNWIIEMQLRPFANDMLWVLFTSVLLLLALPPLFAAWEKDS